MRIAVCSGSFDPITLGHLDIIRRAAAMFDHVIVAVLLNDKKTYTFSVEDRVAMINDSIADLTNVSGMIDKGMTNEEILAVAFRDIEFDVFDEYEVSYKCTCNEERTKKALLSLGEKELDRLFAEQLEDNGCDYLTVECKFCDKRCEYRKSDFDGDFLTDKNSEA